MSAILPTLTFAPQEAQSNITTVVLQNVSLATAGSYKCEVVADHPTFEKDSQLENMEVIGEYYRTGVTIFLYI